MVSKPTLFEVMVPGSTQVLNKIILSYACRYLFLFFISNSKVLEVDSNLIVDTLQAEKMSLIFN